MTHGEEFVNIDAFSAPGGGKSAFPHALAIFQAEHAWRPWSWPGCRCLKAGWHRGGEADTLVGARCPEAK